MNEQQPQRTTDQAKDAMNLTVAVLLACGGVFAAATTEPRGVGKRLLGTKAFALGIGIHAVLIGLSVPQGGLFWIGAMLWMACVRHLVWPCETHTFLLGRPMLHPQDWRGRWLTAAVAAGLALYLYDIPRWSGPAMSLALGAGSSLVLLGVVTARQKAIRADADDARYEAHVLHEHMRPRF